MSDKRPNINIRISDAEKAEIEAMCQDAGIAPATLAKKCLLSALDHYKAHGMVPLPPVILPASSLQYKQIAQEQQDAIERAKLAALQNPTSPKRAAS